MKVIELKVSTTTSEFLAIRVTIVAGCCTISINNFDGGNVGKHNNK